MIAIIFSKDRAFQLEAGLRSLLGQCTRTAMLDICVIYAASQPLHVSGYHQVAQEYGRRGVRFICQSDFRYDLLAALFGSGSWPMPSRWQQRLLRVQAAVGVMPGRHEPPSDQTVLFLVDDNLFVRPFDPAEVETALRDNPDAIGVSLRLGRNTTYCYPQGRAQRVPETRTCGSLLAARWTHADGDFGYPLEVSSSVFRIGDMARALPQLAFRHPNSLEQNMAGHAGMFRRVRPWLLFPEVSVAFCNPVNMVQTEFANRSGQCTDFGTDRLAAAFAAGQRMDLEPLVGFVPNACHVEIPIRFVQGVVAR